MKYLMGIDNGGTFSKAAIFDELGNQIAISAKKTPLITPKSGYTQRNMDELWHVNVDVIRDVIEKSHLSSNDIKAISFSGHGKGLYMVDDKGSPVYDGIISTDNRAFKYVENWNKLGIDKAIYDKTYQKILVSQPVSILRWFKDNMPDILKKAKYIFAVKDFIRYKLTGEAYAEYTDFSGSNLINMNIGNYDVELLKLFDLEEIYDKLPHLKNSTDICGYVTKEAAKETGLKQGTVVAAGMFDVDACGIASGLSCEENLCMVAGTWSINEYIRKSPIKDGSIDLNSMFCIPNYYLIEESSPTSAGNMQWFIQNLMNFEEDICNHKNESIYDLTNSYVKNMPYDDKLIFLPFLNGSNVNPRAKASFIGLSAYHNKKHMLRAVYEGVVFSHLTHLNKLLKKREKPKSIQLSGGAANSDIWIQIFADILQIPIDVIESLELGAKGAAMSAGIAVDIYNDYIDAIEKTVKITKTVFPNEKLKKIYEQKYDLYQSIVTSLDDIWKKFNS